MKAKDHVSIKKIIESVLNDLQLKEIQYADVRVTQLDRETISGQTGVSPDREFSGSFGMGVRVLRKGAWGYAASVFVNVEEGIRQGRKASALANAAALLQQQPIQLAPIKPVVAKWRTPCRIDPFQTTSDEKERLLTDTLSAPMTVQGVTGVDGYLTFQRRRSWLGTSEGSWIDQEIIISGIAMSIHARNDRESMTRSWPSSHGGYTCTGGLELIRNKIQHDSICKAADEAVALLSAPPCPEGAFNVVIAPDQMGLQIHESIGHPLELDRVFGVEANFSGTSFASVDSLGSLRFGSPLVNVVTDPLESGVLGGYAYDDDGVPASSVPLIRQGIHVGYLSGRETAARIGMASSGNNRSSDWSHYPINRMSNTRLEPGDLSWNDLLAMVDSGLLLVTNRSWSIDDRRDSFRFECEIAREIKGGKLGRLYRNPSYSGRTLEFWRNCNGLGNRELYENWGTPTCGKGEPSQSIHTSQGAPPASFLNVAVAPSVKRKGHPHGKR